MDGVDGSERVLGSFELRGTLGRGAMAVVWRAYDMSLDREVAIKEPSLPPGGDDDVRAEYARRFVREARAAARLNHPGIVTIHSASLDGGRPLIVMELVEGSTLRRVLDAQTLTASQTYALLEQLLSATAFAHEHGVIHPTRTAKRVFDRFTTADDDYGFTKTVVPVVLARYGDDNLVSRSQARRLLARVDRFRVVVLDFEGVDAIGQAFADEVFRVFPGEHPEVELQQTNARAAVKRMISRARSV